MPCGSGSLSATVNLVGIGGIRNVPFRGHADLRANKLSLLKILGRTIGTPSCMLQGEGHVC